MSYKLLTNLLFEPKGKHDPSLTYTIKDTVMSDDGSKVYFALKDVPAGIPLSDTEYWMLQMDLSASKNAMDAAAATAKTQTDAVTKSAQDKVDSMVDAAADAIANLNDYTEQYGLRVRGETAKASGNPVTFLPDAGSLLQPVTVLEPQQAGSGDPSPDNIRPFIGYDKLGLNVTGKNIYNPSEAISKGNFEHHGVTGTWRDDGDLILNGTLTSNAWQSIGTSHMMSGKTYTVSVGGNVIVAVWDRVADAFVGSATLGTPLTFTAHSAGTYAYAIASGTGASFADERVMLMVTEGAIATGWQPYQGTLRTVQIGQTVYGIRYEWLTGKAWIEWAMKTLDGTEAFQTSDDGAHFYLYVYTAPTSSDGSVINVVSSHFKGVAESDRMGSEPLVYLMSDHNAVEFRNTGFADVTAWKAYLAAHKAAGTPVQVCWKLVQPIGIQLTPTLVMALDSEETNYIYGDGDIEVEYVKPLKVSIAERVDMLLDTFAEPFEKTGNIVTCEPVAGIEFDSVVTVLEPQQEGSGEPYPAGGGKNKLVNTATTRTVNGITFTVNVDGSINVAGTATSTAQLIVGKYNLPHGDYIISGGAPGISCYTYLSTPSGTVYKDSQGADVAFTLSADAQGDTVMLQVVSDKTVDALAYPMIRLASDPDSTYAPPSNIRPFIGYDKLGLNHAGKNLLPNASAGTKTVNGITLTSNGDGSYNLNGAASSGASIYFALENSVTIPGGAYWHLLNEGITVGAAFTPKFSDGTTGSIAFSIANRVGAIAENLTGKTITEFGVYVQGGTTLDITFKPMLCLSDAPSDFVPYQGTLRTVQIGQTVYGIRYEWLTGKAVIEWAMETLKSADASKWTYVTDYGSVSRFNYNNNNVMPSGDVICSAFPTVSIGTSDVEGIAVHGSQRQIILQVKTDRLASKDVDGLSAWLAGTPVQITYKLATPIEIQLTPTEIIALSGVNNLYGSGKTTVAGRQSKDVDILRRLTTLETLLTNQTKGE